MDQINKDKKDYEISFLTANPDGGDEVKNLLSKYEAEILYEGPIVETKLAYPIKKSSHAYFGFLHFRSLPNTVEKIVQSLKLNSIIMRTLLVTPPITKGSNLQKFQKREVREPKTFQANIKSIEAPAVSANVKGGMLTNEALEEKLEEILK